MTEQPAMSSQSVSCASHSDSPTQSKQAVQLTPCALQTGGAPVASPRPVDSKPVMPVDAKPVESESTVATVSSPVSSVPDEVEDVGSPDGTQMLAMHSSPAPHTPSSHAHTLVPGVHPVFPGGSPVVSDGVPVDPSLGATHCP